MKNTIIIVVIVAIVVGAGSFYGGILYGKSQAAGARNLAFGQRQGFGANGGTQARGGNRAAGGGFVNGEIIAKDDKSVTIKSVDGGSKIIFLAASTQITKSVGGSITDLELGKNVMITGSANSDGSVTAQSIQLRPNLPINATSTPPVR